MDQADPIEVYLGELKRALRVSRRRRGRILAEVRAHLLDAAEAESSSLGDAADAAECAILRFGSVAETATQFNRRTGGMLRRRALAPAVVAVAVTSTATATVWAFNPGSAPPRPRPASSHPIRRTAPRERPHAAVLPKHAKARGAQSHGR